MLHTVADDVTDPTPSALKAGYREQLESTLTSVGLPTVQAETTLGRETLSAVADGDISTLTLDEAASILAAGDDAPAADAIVFEVRDHLLMGMTTAVLDVDTVAARLDLDLTGQEVQQAIEGRIPMTLEQLAAIHSVIETGSN